MAETQSLLGWICLYPLTQPHLASRVQVSFKVRPETLPGKNEALAVVGAAGQFSACFEKPVS